MLTRLRIWIESLGYYFPANRRIGKRIDELAQSPLNTFDPVLTAKHEEHQRGEITWEEFREFAQRRWEERRS